MCERDNNEQENLILLDMSIEIISDINNLCDLAYKLVDLQSIYGSFYHILLGNAISENYSSITVTRNFNRKYSNALVLRGFRNGSIILDTLTGIATALITEFLKRTIWHGQEKIQTVYNNCIIINCNDERSQNIILRNNFNDGVILEKQEEVTQYIDEFFNNLDLQQGNHERNIMLFFEQLQRDGYIHIDYMNELYNEKGVRIIAKNIRRFDRLV